jgi:protein-arginine kinase activator protein McsA
VQEKVAEIMAERDAVVFEPFFRSRQIAYELKRLQTMPEQRKWWVFFERYGCLICETRERIHVGNGMCTQCYSRTFQTLKQIIAEEITGERAHAAGTASSPEPSRMLPATVHRRWNPRKRKSLKR